MGIEGVQHSNQVIAKLADFGSAQEFQTNDDTMTKTEGTYYFLAPECCDRKISFIADR